MGFLIHERKAKIAISVGIGVLLVLSAVAYVAFLVPGASAYPPTPCTKTYSSTSPPPTELAIATSGTYCFTSGETFNTQITVTVSDVTLTTTLGPRPAIIEPSALTTTDDIILVSGTSSLTRETVSNLVVDGSIVAPTLVSCGDAFEGILFQNAGGTITGSTVQNIYLAGTGFYGCQAGLAIDVESTTGVSVVSISSDQALNYQKNGITCDGAGSRCDIAGNTVSPFAAAEQFIGSNGIQVAFGAQAQVVGNTVSGNECSLESACGDYLNDPAGNNINNDAAGILLYQAGSGTVVNNNQVSSNDFGISVDGLNAGVQLQNNRLTNNRYVGVMIESGAYTVQNTQISGPSGAAAVAVEALMMNGDVSSSVTLVNVNTSLPYFTFASGEGLTAYIFVG